MGWLEWLLVRPIRSACHVADVGQFQQPLEDLAHGKRRDERLQVADEIFQHHADWGPLDDEGDVPTPMDENFGDLEIGRMVHRDADLEGTEASRKGEITDREAIVEGEGQPG